MALRPATKKSLQAACPELTLGERLGVGGNAVVYAAISSSYGEVAVKFMLNDNTKRYGRFRDEVLVVTTTLQGSMRVIPILAHHLPDVPSEQDVPRYVMPRALTIKKRLTGAQWPVKLNALIELAEGLAEIHALGVAHRDIKPENILELDGTFRFGDFGIAAFPESSGLTEKKEPMGPSPGFMAPEMMTDSEAADPMKADVYSFAKTVWAVLTGKERAFMGQYMPGSLVGLIQVAPLDLAGFAAEPLDRLLSRSTDMDPAQRPTAEEFAKLLRDVVTIQDDWRRVNVIQWEAAELEALRVPGLLRATWEDAKSIAAVMNILSRRQGLNHLFFPRGGGQAIESVSVCEGGRMLLMKVAESGMVAVSPVRLTLERFSENAEFSYAVLEAADTAPLGVEERFTDSECEMLRQVNDFDYVPDDQDDDDNLNSGVGVPCQRFFKGGVFALAPTSGLYNDLDDYGGTATKLGVEKLRAWFQSYFEQQVVPKVGVALVRQVRLLKNAVDANEDFILQYLTSNHLDALIAFDDSLMNERAQGRTGRVLGSAEVLELVLKEPSDGKKQALKFLQGLTVAQRGEYLSLVLLGRGERRPAEFAGQTEMFATYPQHDSYLLEKLGNGYMRRALKRFGMTVLKDGKVEGLK